MRIRLPRLERRNERHYVAIRTHVTRPELSSKLPPLIGELAAWLDARGEAPTGAPFFRYLFIGEDGHFDIDVGFPVAHAIASDDRVTMSILPAGHYAVTIHTGPYDQLRDATAALKRWAAENGVQWDASDDETRWGARIESYLTDPTTEPDPEKWQTEIAIRTKDA